MAMKFGDLCLVLGKLCENQRVDVPREYRKLIHFVMCEMVLKIGIIWPMWSMRTRSAVFKTIVDPTCMAWRRAHCMAQKLEIPARLTEN